MKVLFRANASSFLHLDGSLFGGLKGGLKSLKKSLWAECACTDNRIMCPRKGRKTLYLINKPTVIKSKSKRETSSLKRWFHLLPGIPFRWTTWFTMNIISSVIVRSFLTATQLLRDQCEAVGNRPKGQKNMTSNDSKKFKVDIPYKLLGIIDNFTALQFWLSWCVWLLLRLRLGTLPSQVQATFLRCLFFFIFLILSDFPHSYFEYSYMGIHIFWDRVSLSMNFLEFTT